jgi:hypothetical protein
MEGLMEDSQPPLNAKASPGEESVERPETHTELQAEHTVEAELLVSLTDWDRSSCLSCLAIERECLGVK